MLESLALYVHFPWCVRKCPYCDFNSHPLRHTDDFDGYLQALLQDWRQQQRQFSISQPFHSVFLGGGTPSLFGADHMHALLEHMPLAADAEITMEANPGTTEHAHFAGYRQAGVNRLSLGAQSFNDTQLARLGRIHAAADTRRAFDQARAANFENINIDLMWGLPGQTVAAAMADLDAAIRLGCEHISWYQLTLEPKTEFHRRPPVLPVEDVLFEIEQQGLLLLEQQGYQRYEVSAFARNDLRCRHNVNYWRFGDYVGIGAGAHGKLTAPANHASQIVRTRKASQPRLYQQSPQRTQTHCVTADALPAEFMMNALRLIDGVPFEVFEQRTGLDWSEVSPTWARLQQQDLVAANRCAATPLGMRYLDSVLAQFVDCA